MALARDKAEQLFRVPFKPIASASAASSPQSIKDDADKVLVALSRGGLEISEMIEKTGLGGVDTAKALKYLIHDVSPPLVHKVERTVNTQNGPQTLHRYYLTEEAKRDRPITGRVHLKGVAGKVAVNADGGMVLNGGRGQLLKAIQDAKEPIDLATLHNITGLHMVTVSLYCKELEKKYQAISAIWDGKRKLVRANKLEIRESAPPPPATPHEITKVEPNLVAKAMGIKPPPEKLTETISSLFAAGYEAGDILLEVATIVQQEVDELRSFQDSMINLGSH